ncbi:MAG TPA: non-homologous end-joining DNA ligase [Gemmatimonadota bacterium]|nr:non-homologous end-joining DNA ligase [Gemmatimonadota bacterium]
MPTAWRPLVSGAEKIRIGRRALSLSSLDKVLFPDVGVTKGDLIEHYRRVAARMVPHMKGRPVSMQRYPDGIEGQGFYQKDAPDYFPAWIRRVTVEKKGGTVEHAVCDDAATLVYLANQNCITPHVWLSRADRLHHPDRLIFDLDPPGEDFDAVRFAARAARELLGELGLEAYPMTTGGRGIHLLVPLDRRADFDAVRDFARDAADVLAGRHAGHLTTEARKNKRHGRLFLDVMRNSYAQTAVPPYAVRARAGAPVAVPIAWRELSDPGLTGSKWNTRNIASRLRKKDPWESLARHGRSLKEPRRKLDRLLAVAKGG